MFCEVYELEKEKKLKHYVWFIKGQNGLNGKAE